MDQKMRKKIPHLLIPIIYTSFDAVKGNTRKIVQKIDFMEVKIAWVELKSYKAVGFISSTCLKSMFYYTGYNKCMCNLIYDCMYGQPVTVLNRPSSD